MRSTPYIISERFHRTTSITVKHIFLQVVNTLLSTPGAPRINTTSGKSATTTTGVWDTRVRLRWDASAGGCGAAAPLTGVGGLIAGGGGGGGRGGTATNRAATNILMQVGPR